MSITPFLLARIAEEEHAVEQQAAQAPPAWLDWMRSSSEVKRRIVALHAAHSNEGEVWDPACTVLRSDVMSPDVCPTLRELALSYADHPDFREEWRG